MKLILTVTKWYQLDNGHFTERKRGELIEVNDQVGEWLLRHGSAKHPDEETSTTDTPVDEDPTSDTVTPDDSSDAPDDDPADKDDQPQRPANAANRPTWDAYARKVGVDPTQFKSKEELMAALP